MNNLRKIKIAIIVALTLIVIGYAVNLLMSEDRVNRFSRIGISYLNGDYKVTYAAFSGDKVWVVNGGKITSEPEKGYYFFWATQPDSKNKTYVQVPMASTIIEEITN